MSSRCGFHTTWLIRTGSHTLQDLQPGGIPTSLSGLQATFCHEKTPWRWHKKRGFFSSKMDVCRKVCGPSCLSADLNPFCSCCRAVAFGFWVPLPSLCVGSSPLPNMSRYLACLKSFASSGSQIASFKGSHTPIEHQICKRWRWRCGWMWCGAALLTSTVEGPIGAECDEDRRWPRGRRVVSIWLKWKPIAAESGPVLNWMRWLTHRGRGKIWFNWKSEMSKVSC